MLRQVAQRVGTVQSAGNDFLLTTHVRVFVSFVCAGAGLYVCTFLHVYVCTFVHMYACNLSKFYVGTDVRLYILYVCSFAHL